MNDIDIEEGRAPTCPLCKCRRLAVDLPSFMTPVLLGGIRHHDWCPAVPHLSAKDEAALQARLDEFDRVRCRGAFEVRTRWIG